MPSFARALPAALALCLAAVPLASQEAADAEPEPTAPGEPGPEHALLGHLVGDWSFTLKVWSAPGAEPAVTRGTAEGRWILGGRFVHTVYRAELFGRPFEGWAIEGHHGGRYVRTWQDNFGTYTAVYRGDLDEATGVRTLTAPFTDPASGESFETRVVLTASSDDAYRFETQVVLGPETTFTAMELEAERRGGSAGEP